MENKARASGFEHSIAARKDDLDTIAKKEAVHHDDSGKTYLRTTKVSSLFPTGKLKIVSVSQTEPASHAFKVSRGFVSFSFD
jgi:hypothetical protein